MAVVVVIGLACAAASGATPPVPPPVGERLDVWALLDGRQDEASEQRRLEAFDRANGYPNPHMTDLGRADMCLRLAALYNMQGRYRARVAPGDGSAERSFEAALTLTARALELAPEHEHRDYVLWERASALCALRPGSPCVEALEDVVLTGGVTSAVASAGLGDLAGDPARARAAYAAAAVGPVYSLYATYRLAGVAARDGELVQAARLLMAVVEERGGDFRAGPIVEAAILDLRSLGAPAHADALPSIAAALVQTRPGAAGAAEVVRELAQVGASELAFAALEVFVATHLDDRRAVRSAFVSFMDADVGETLARCAASLYLERHPDGGLAHRMRALLASPPVAGADDPSPR